MGRNAKLGVFFGRQVHDDQTVNASLFRLDQKLVDTFIIDRIVIPHQHDGRSVIPLAEIPNHLQSTVHRHPRRQRTLPRQLDRRTIGHRVGERHAQFDHINPCRRKPAHDFKASIIVRIARHDERNEGGFALGFQVGEFRVYTCHIWHPLGLSMVCAMEAGKSMPESAIQLDPFVAPP